MAHSISFPRKNAFPPDARAGRSQLKRRNTGRGGERGKEKRNDGSKGLSLREYGSGKKKYMVIR